MIVSNPENADRRTEIILNSGGSSEFGSIEINANNGLGNINLQCEYLKINGKEYSQEILMAVPDYLKSYYGSSLASQSWCNNNFAPKDHTHSGYAPKEHSHSKYTTKNEVKTIIKQMVKSSALK